MTPTLQVEATLFSALVEAARRFGRNAPGYWEDMKPGQYSHGDVLKMTLALGRLASKVTEPGEHVGVLMPNMVTTVALMIGLSAWGRVPCMLNYTAGADGMLSACHTAAVRKIFTSRQFLQKAGLEEQAAGLTDEDLIYLEDLRDQFNLIDKAWLMGFALWAPELAVPEGDPEAPAVVLFTSGSEGKPKAVVLSHRALLSNVAQVLSRFPFGPGDVVFNCLPIFHSFGLTGGTLIPMVSGARLVIYPSPLHFKEIPKLIRDKRATLLYGTSTFLGHYARNAEQDDFATLKYVVAGAEKLSDSVLQTWKERFGIDILQGYGATEAATIVSVNVPGQNRPGTCGRLMPELEARIVPVRGIDKGGELHVRGPNLMSGYYLHDAPGVLVPPCSEVGEGWYDTGDVVEIDADGYVSIQGRLKRFAKVAGEMVSLELAETIARAVSAEEVHAATCISDEGRGEVIVLFTTDSDLSREQLASVARGLGYPEICVPKRISVVDDLPLLGSGKVDYHRLKHLADMLHLKHRGDDAPTDRKKWSRPFRHRK